MSDKKKGLFQKYEVKKLTNPKKKMDCIVLEFDDHNSWPAVAVFARRMRAEGYEKLAKDVEKKLKKNGCDVKTKPLGWFMGSFVTNKYAHHGDC